MDTQASNISAWRAKFAWFWYNTAEIFHFTQEDMDRKMARYAAQGITHVITFSSTHFRWSFKPWWPQINACIAKIVKSAHRYGIKVIEHHSSCLTWCPDPAISPVHRPAFENGLKGRNSSIDDFPGILEYCLDLSKPESQWEQIDAVSGNRLSCRYHGHIKCPSNPDYMKAYLNYLEDVYATGVDGIMTDDMGAEEHFIFPKDDGPIVRISSSCGCKYCRERFRREYGYDFPSGDQWEKWYGNLEDKTFLDYLHFLHRKFNDFHGAIKRHYEGLGLKMLRPNYTSSPMTSNRYCSNPCTYPQLDWFFQECMYTRAIRYSWPHFMTQQKLIALVARRRGIPHMMMFYANRPDSLLFSFGVCRLAGAMLTNTPEGENNTDETALRQYEDKYASLLFGVEELPVVGFLDSEENRFYGAGYQETRLTYWLKTTFFKNIPSTMFSIDEPENWQTPVLVANELHLLAEEEIRALQEYARKGGALVLTGICGEQDKDGGFRTREEINALWGLDLYDESIADAYRTIPYGRGSITIVGYNFGYHADKEANYRHFVFDERRRNRDYVDHPRSDIFVCQMPRRGKEEKSRPIEDYYAIYDELVPQIDAIASLLTGLAKGRLSFQAELPKHIVAMPYHSPSDHAIAIQLLNAADTLPTQKGQLVSHNDPIPFPAWQGGDGILKVSLPEDVRAESAFFADVHGAFQPLPLTVKDNSAVVTLPAGLLKDYGMVCITKQQAR